MIARASQLFLPTLRDAPADAEALSHKLLVRGGFIRQVGAGLWTYLPLGWRVHRKVEQVVREEMDAIGAQEMFAPVLTPAELWITSGPLRHPRALQAQGPQRPRIHPPAHARGDVHVPRARAAELPAAAAGLVPLPDEGPRRAAAPWRAAAGPRVHHEGLVLVRPRRRRPRRQLPGAPGRLRADLGALRHRDGLRRGGERDDGRQRVVRLPGAVRLRREHARHLRERRLRGRPRDRTRRPASA